MKKRIFCLFIALILVFALFNISVYAENGEENLALGKNYIINSDVANSKSYAEMDTDDGKRLTDGVFGRNDWADTAHWSKFYRAVGRTVIIDLGSVCEIHSVKTNFLCDNTAGVYLPNKFSVYVSADGINFSEAKAKNGNELNYSHSENKPCWTLKLDMPVEPVSGRYVAVHFDVDVNCFADEIQVFGKKDTTLAPPTEYTDILPAPKGSYMSPDVLGGDRDIILFHTGYYPDDLSLVNNNEATFLPFIAYIDDKGKIADTMFDSVMFLILQGRCPSGGNLCVAEGPSVLSDWQMMLDQYFSDEYNLKALDNAAQTVKDALELEDYKVSVYLTCPYPKISDIVFGDYDGDGKDNKIQTYDDCLKVTEWFVDECIKLFDEKHYKNLVLKGFFCNNESLGGQRHDYERQYAADCCKMFKERDLYCVMIPFYQASGIDDWENIGFDAVLMQPNLSFNPGLQDDPAGCMEDFAETCKQYGMGIEIEAHSSLVWDKDAHGSNYVQYLESSVANGMMTDTLHAYYNGAGAAVYGRAAYSTDKYLRWIYDITYKFIKGTLDLPTERISGDNTAKLELAVGEKATGKTGILGDWYGTIEFTEKPEHGFVVLSPDCKTYTYTGDRKYFGADKFEYDLVVGGKTMEHVVVEVDIKGEEADTSENASEAAFTPNDSSHGVLRIVIYALISVSALGAIIFVVFKKIGKKKAK